MFDDQLRMAGTAAFFDLGDNADRTRSKTTLIDLFFDLQVFIEPSVFLEIGAFDAGFSKRAKKNFPQATVIAFEANPNNFEYHSSQFDFGAHGIDYRHQAVSDKVGTIEFQIQTLRNGVPAERVKGDDSLLKRAYEGVEYESVTVRTTTLDAELTAQGLSSEMLSCWIDVEGATELVFRGGPETLKRTQSIFVEVEEKQYWEGQWLLKDIVLFLAGHGFKAIARDFENAHQFNVVFVHERLMSHYMFADRYVNYMNRIGQRV